MPPWTRCMSAMWGDSDRVWLSPAALTGAYGTVTVFSKNALGVPRTGTWLYATAGGWRRSWGEAVQPSVRFRENFMTFLWILHRLAVWFSRLGFCKKGRPPCRRDVRVGSSGRARRGKHTVSVSIEWSPVRGVRKGDFPPP